MRNDIDSQEEREFKDLFSAFKDVHASDELKQRTLEAIANLQHDAEYTDKAAGADKAQDLNVQEKVSIPLNPKKRLRVIRTLAIAACLAFACLGGAAWAIPTTQVTVEADNQTMTLGVNRFGVVVSAESDSEEGQHLIDQADVAYKGYEESLERLLGTLESDNKSGVEISVASRNEDMRMQIEEHGATIIEQRGLNRKDTTSLNSSSQDRTTNHQAQSTHGTEPNLGQEQPNVQKEQQAPSNQRETAQNQNTSTQNGSSTPPQTQEQNTAGSQNNIQQTPPSTGNQDSAPAQDATDQGQYEPERLAPQQNPAQNAPNDAEGSNPGAKPNGSEPGKGSQR